MKKTSAILQILFCVLGGLSMNCVWAAPVDTLVAKQVASHFIQSRTADAPQRSNALKLVYTATYQSRATSRSANCLYIYSTGKGFVIVTADDRLMPVLGYSDEGHFDMDNIPENMQQMLNFYMDEIQQYLNQAEAQPNAATEEWQKLIRGTYNKTSRSGGGIGPLLNTTWDQNRPYNSLCPIDSAADPDELGYRTYAGCVATAMAQVIRYWEYPSQGVGSYSYECNYSSQGYGDYGVLSVNFGVGSYNYSLMPNYITNSSPQSQITAIARLIYHCGVSVGMMYGIDGSGGSTYTARSSLERYFKYSTSYGTLTPQHKYKSSYSSDDWVALIKNELDNWRPVIYDGQGTGGHAFVCDGYNDQGYFHFNWGWSGSYNGYYLLSALTPGYYNFTYSQAAVINIQGNTPLIKTSSGELSFISATNSFSEVNNLSIHGVALSRDITVNAPANFEISTDGINFYTSLTISGSGTTTIYIRYTPTATTLTTDQGMLTLTSGGVTQTVSLTGMTYILDCNPPQDAQGTHDNGTAQLSWTAPTQIINTYRFSWDSAAVTTSGYNMSNWTIKAVHRMTESELVNFHKKQLTQVSFFARPGGSSYKIVVFKGGSYANGAFSQGTQVVSQSVSSVSNNRWNTITLDAPVDIDATEELWYGIQFTASSSSYPLAIASGTYVPGKGGVIYIDGYGWMEFKNIGAERNFPLKAIFQDAPATITGYTIDRNDVTIGSTASTTYQDHITTTGTYTYNITANWSNGCSATSDGITMSIVTDCPTLTGDTTANACGSFSWYDYTNLSISGEYTHTLQNASGCDSVVTLHLTINQPTTGDTNAVACGSFDWYEYPGISTSGTYTHTFVGGNAHGCDSTVTLHLTINQPTTGDTNAVACGSFDWYEYPGITSSGDYTHIFVGGNANGCDSTVTLHLTINQPTTGDTNAVACGSFDWYEYPGITSSGDYTHIFVGGNANGCDSTVTLHLTVNQPTTGDTNAVVCGSFDWYEYSGISTSGTYTHTFVGGNANGCDSTVTLHLTVNQPSTGDTNAVVCGSFDWYEYPGITSSGDYTHIFVGGNANGCDSTVTLHLTINQPTTGDTNAVACGSFDWYEYPNISTSGTYTHTFVGGNAHGCDSTVTLHLTVNQPTTGDTNAVACGSFDWYEYSGISTSGTYTHTFVGGNANGCDSTVTLHLTVNQPTTGDTNAVACGSFDWYENPNISTSGTYTHTFVGGNAHGCDSTVTLHLTVNQPTTGDTNAVACGSFDWYEYSGISTSGTYTHTFVGGNANGCDSTVTLHLTVNLPTTGDTNAVACGSFDWYEHMNITSSTSSLTHTFINAKGCDSVVTLHLVINNPVHTSTVEEAVETFVWLREGATDTTITTSGTYMHTHPDANGCAQTDTLHLTVYHATGSQIDTAACESFDWHRPIAGDTTLLDSGIYRDTLTDVHGADSVVTLVLTIKHGSYVPLSVAECGSYSWHDTTRTESGTYLFEYINNEGCPSTDTLHLAINNPVHTSAVEEAVEAFVWLREGAADTTITTSGTYMHTHPDANGCAQTDTLHLTVYHATGTQIDTAACESFVWQRLLAGDTTLLASGIYRDTLTDVHGADSVVTLVLNIKHGSYVPLSVAECDSYIWHDTAYTESGTYLFEYLNDEGCPSTDTLHLAINNPVHTNAVEEAVEAYVWHRAGAADTTITTSGTYTHTHPDANGCTQTDTLHLTVYHATGTQIDTSACEEFLWQRPIAGDTALLDSGIYRDTLTDVHGADSVITLVLTVNHGSFIPLSVAECGSYSWHDTTRTESGTYLFEYLNNEGCPSTDTLHLVINNPVHTSTVEEAVEAYTWHREGAADTTITTSGTYTHTHPDANGCAQTDTLHLTVYHATGTQIDTAVCESFVWHRPLAGDTTLLASGIYRDTLTDVHGADSVVTLALTINPSYYIPEEVTVMEAQLPYQWHGRTFNENTTAFDSLLTRAGCDSVFFLNLTVTPFNIIQDNPITLCQGETQLWRGQLLSEQGSYSDTVLAENTIYTVDVTINPTYNIQENMSVCESTLPFTWHNQTVTGPGIYTDSSQTTFSCDSIHTLSVYVTNVTTQEDSMTVCGEDATYTWHNMTLSETGIYSDTLRNTNGCDSIVYTMNFVKGSPFFSEDSVHLSVVTLPYVWHGMAISDAGVYYDSLQTSVGCDSVYSLQAYYYDWLIVDTPITLCPGDTVFWRMRTITESGTYRDTVFRWGDRFIFSVVVTMGEPFYHNDTVTICQDELPYIWHEQSIDTSGTSILRLQTVAGCDSIYMLTLTVSPSIRQNDTAETCQGTPYAWRGLQLETSGYYVDSVENTSGCEDVYTLLLTVNPTYSVDTAVTITTNDLPYHFVSGQIDTTFATLDSQFSTFNFQFSTIEGCDSVITLNITLNVGIEHHSLENAIKAFPNPTTGQLTVVGSSELTQIQLFDAYGRRVCVYPVEGTQTEIDLHGLASGIYILKAMRHNQMAGTLKIIKNNE